MEVLAQVTINRQSSPAIIQLLQGDLTAIPAEHAADILAVSAYPGNYSTHDKRTLISALDSKGLSVAALAAEKEVDLVNPLSCWLSKPLTPSQQRQFNFKRVLCFEPPLRSVDPEVAVGNIFRCINSFAFSEQNNVIAMPVLASGNQKVPIEQMLPVMLEAAVFWLGNGLPFDAIKLVLYTAEQVRIALPIFASFRNRINAPASRGRSRGALVEESGRSLSLSPQETPAETIAKKNEYDIFISYAHTNTQVVNSFVTELLSVKKDLNIFYDRTSIPPGGLWLRKISDAIQKARKVLIFLSPDYSDSMVCWDEFQCAKVIEYSRKTSLIQTVYLYNYTNSEMPPIMAINSWIDCREGDAEKLRAIISQIAG